MLPPWNGVWWITSNSPTFNPRNWATCQVCLQSNFFNSTDSPLLTGSSPPDQYQLKCDLALCSLGTLACPLAVPRIFHLVLRFQLYTKHQQAVQGRCYYWPGSNAGWQLWNIGAQAILASATCLSNESMVCHSHILQKKKSLVLGTLLGHAFLLPCCDSIIFSQESMFTKFLLLAKMLRLRL